MEHGHWAAGGGGSGRRDQGSGNPAVGGGRDVPGPALSGKEGLVRGQG